MFLDILMFLLSTIGMCHIIVDSSIMARFREIFKWLTFKLRIGYFGTLVDCYLCCGTWCGFFMGYVWITHDLSLRTFACGCAGGFVSNFAVVIANYVESATLINLPENESNGK